MLVGHLKKYAIIGQSGTGKTSILNLIKCFTHPQEEKLDKECLQISHELLHDGSIEIFYDLEGRKFSKKYDAEGKISHYEKPVR